MKCLQCGAKLQKKIKYAFKRNEGIKYPKDVVIVDIFTVKVPIETTYGYKGTPFCCEAHALEYAQGARLLGLRGDVY